MAFQGALQWQDLAVSAAKAGTAKGRMGHASKIVDNQLFLRRY